MATLQPTEPQIDFTFHFFPVIMNTCCFFSYAFVAVLNDKNAPCCLHCTLLSGRQSFFFCCKHESLQTMYLYIHNISAGGTHTHTRTHAQQQGMTQHPGAPLSFFFPHYVALGSIKRISSYLNSPHPHPRPPCTRKPWAQAPFPSKRAPEETHEQQPDKWSSRGWPRVPERRRTRAAPAALIQLGDEAKPGCGRSDWIWCTESPCQGAQRHADTALLPSFHFVVHKGGGRRMAMEWWDSTAPRSAAERKGPLWRGVGGVHGKCWFFFFFFSVNAQ